MSTGASAQIGFITKWNTTNYGGTPDNQISFPGIGENYTINWIKEGFPLYIGDTIGNGTTILTFPAPGIYKIYVTPGNGTFNGVNFQNNYDRSKIIDIEQWGDIVWLSMENAFLGCDNLSNLSATDAPNLSQVTSMASCFKLCRNLNCSLDNWDISNVQDLSYSFQYAEKFNGSIGNWNVSNCTTMEGMFFGAEKFNQPIGDWDVSKVSDMSRMFDTAKDFNQNINNWDISKVENLHGTFGGAYSFNQPLDKWNTSSVNNMIGVFLNAISFNQPIDNWDVGNVVNMAFLFAGGENFNQSLENWDVSKVSNMSGMFARALQFNQPLNNWNVSNVLTMYEIFYNCSNFNQDLGNWNVSNVTDMGIIFYEASSFNQHLGNWQLHPEVNMLGMLSFSGMSCDNYSATIIDWAQNPNTPVGRKLGAEGLPFGTNAVNSRQKLIQELGWDITGDIPLEESCGTTSIDFDASRAEAKVVIWPNPVAEVLYIDIPEDDHTDYRIIILNTNGQPVLLNTLQDSTEPIDVHSLPSGVYFIEILQGQRRRYSKFIKL